MGCVYSREEFENANPRVFQVWNVDGEGRNVKPGKIEVTESQLVLYQKGDITVRWPLRSLRRYGFDAELFSFECGRRCPTGPGVYAFRCRRAEALFNILQECIQSTGGGNGNISVAAIDDQISLSAPAAMMSMGTSNGSVTNGSVPSTMSRQTPAVDSSGYLEPIVSNHHQQCPLNAGGSRSCGNSPSGIVCIHSAGSEGATVEWSANGVRSSMPSCCSLGSCSRNSNHHYVNRDVVEQASASFSGCLCTMHQYANASVIATDPSRRCCSPRSSSQSTYVNSHVTSPAHLPCSSGCCSMNCVDVNTNYAKLDDLLKQEQSVKRQKEQRHFYVNVKTEQSGIATCNSRCVSGRSTPTDAPSRSGIVTSPAGKAQQLHFYANLSPQKSVDSLNVPGRETVKTQVNYAVLDLDNNNTTPYPSSSSAAASGNSLPATPARSPEGYVQIDFDKTVALSNSAIPCASNDDSIRKTRHNAVIPCSSMPS